MKLELIMANEEALRVLSEVKLEDAQLAWDIADILDEVEKVITKFQKKRDEYVKEVGTPDPENKGKFQIADPKAFTEEMGKLLDVEVDIVFPAIPLSALGERKISPNEIRGWKALGLLNKPEEEKPETVEPEEEAVEEEKPNDKNNVDGSNTE